MAIERVTESFANGLRGGRSSRFCPRTRVSPEFGSGVSRTLSVASSGSREMSTRRTRRVSEALPVARST